jgi:hypothetical protein
MEVVQEKPASGKYLLMHQEITGLAWTCVRLSSVLQQELHMQTCETSVALEMLCLWAMICVAIQGLAQPPGCRHQSQPRFHYLVLVKPFA